MTKWTDIDPLLVQAAVRATLEETYTFWDGYYIPRGDEEENYVKEVTAVVYKALLEESV